MDTNTVRLILDADSGVLSVLSAIAPDRIWLSSVVVEEILSGRLELIRRAQSGKFPSKVSDTHLAFITSLEDIRPFQILAYSDKAEAVFQCFPANIKRIGTQDCRIAAQALAHEMIVVTRNTRDFERIGSPCEDWSK